MVKVVKYTPDYKMLCSCIKVHQPFLEFHFQRRLMTLKSLISKHAFDVIRGIFDARQSIGRTYSVFYYYSKYVAKECFWIDKLNSLGLLETAQQIYTTFLSLSTHQKQIFVDQSFNFHTQTVKEERYENEEFSGRVWDKRGFPGEPKPPPRSAKKLYWSEVQVNRRKSSKEVFPTWEELDEEKQSFYIKKLYRVTNIYLKEYEEFVSKMSPSDLVAYTVDCYNVWENRYMTTRANHRAAKGFSFPLPRLELVGSEREPSPEIIENEEYMNRLLRPEDEGPFGDDELINLVTENIEPSNECLSEVDDSDVPSDEELLSTDPRHYHFNKKLMAKIEIKRASTLEYPIHFLQD